VSADRLQKLLARAGVASRRAAEALVREGRVRVNGQVVSELGAKADPAVDRIEVDGRAIAREEFVYYLVHKPRGMVTTLQDPEGRPALSELLQGINERVYPVGRLDFNTSGVLLVTNDGDLVQALLHPSKEVPKTYVAKLNEVIDDKSIALLRRGVTLDDGYQTTAASVVRLRDEEGHSWLEITITEGKNRQIHRMIEAAGGRVMRLARNQFAGLTNEGLRPGQIRALEPAEVGQLKQTYQGIPYKPVRPERTDRAEFRALSRDRDLRDVVRDERAKNGDDRASRTERDSPRAMRQRPRDRDLPPDERPRARKDVRSDDRARVQREKPPVRGARNERETPRGQRDQGRERLRESKDRPRVDRERPTERKERPRAENRRDRDSRETPRPKQEQPRERGENPRAKQGKSEPRQAEREKPRADRREPRETTHNTRRTVRSNEEKRPTKIDKPRGSRHKSRPT
jgi:23S rRNA pseudouridine2605 synthase